MMAVYGRTLCLLLICSFFTNFVGGASPYFEPRIWEASLPEVTTTAGTYLNTFSAKDGDNVALTYSLESVANTWFSINSTDGRTVVIKTLDRETMNNGDFQFYVYATDSSGNKGSLRVLLTVTDINDNAPVFQNVPITKAVSEDTPVGFTVLTASVTDADAPPNTYVAYLISGGNEDGRFSIDKFNGHVTIAKSLDYDYDTKTYNLNLTAVNDRSSEPLQSSAIFTVNVTDADDLPANFSRPLYEARVDKNSPMGSVVTEVHAEDMDSFNAPVEYSIYPVSDPEGLFMVNQATGVITVNGNLQNGVISLILNAKSTTHLPAFTLVKVTVGPMADASYTVSVVEGEANISVLSLQPLESQFNISGGTFVFLGNSGAQFVIDDATRTLKVGTQPLDRETRAQHVISMSLLKRGVAKGFAKVTVNVLDVNDNSPSFQAPHPFNLTVEENESLGKVLLTVVAQDSDEGVNGTLTYYITNGNTGGHFTINNRTGAISLVKSLDREARDQFVLTVMVKDDGAPPLDSTTAVNVNVSDVNDNAPIIQPAVINIAVSEGAVSGTVVTDINATDADAGANGRITYAIENGAHGNFAIDPVNGVVTTTGGLSYKIMSQYKLVVTATDGGSPPWSVRGFITVDVTTVSSNNNRPVFSSLSYIGGVYKDTSDNFQVLTVTATDADIGTNGQVHYSIASGNAQGLFYVESTSGHVRTANTFATKEEGQSFSFSIQATDQGSPPKSSQSNAQLVVFHHNRSPPQSSQSNAQITVFLLTQSNSIVIKSGHRHEYILQNLPEFIRDQTYLSGGGHVFIKSVRPGAGNSSVITLNGMKNLSEMTYEQLNDAFVASEGSVKYVKWNITEQGKPPSTGARTGGTEEGLSSMVGALICLSVLVGVGGIVMIIILYKKRRDEVLPRKQTRVTFNDKPLYIDPVGSSQGARADLAQEAQEVIMHMDDETSSIGSDGGRVDPEVLRRYINHAYQHDGQSSDDDSENFGSTEAGEIPNFGTFFPPPPTEPPPPVPNSDDEESTAFQPSNDLDEVGTERTYIPPDEYDLDYEMFDPSPEAVRGAHDGSPTHSVTDSTAQLVEPHTYRDALLHDPFFGFHRRTSVADEKTTEL